MVSFRPNSVTLLPPQKGQADPQYSQHLVKNATKPSPQAMSISMEVRPTKWTGIAHQLEDEPTYLSTNILTILDFFFFNSETPSLFH